MRRIYRFFVHLCRDILDLAIAVALVGWIATGANALFAKVAGGNWFTVWAFIATFVALAVIAVDLEFRVIRFFKNFSWRRFEKPTPSINVYHYNMNDNDCDDCNCDDCDDEDDDDDTVTEEPSDEDDEDEDETVD